MYLPYNILCVLPYILGNLDRPRKLCHYNSFTKQLLGNFTHPQFIDKLIVNFIDIRKTHLDFQSLQLILDY